MENNANSRPLEVCKKMCKAVTVSPPLQTLSRISSRLQHSTSPFSKNIHIQSQPKSRHRIKEAAAEAVPINFDYSRHQQQQRPSPREKPNSSSAIPLESNQKNTRIAKPKIETSGKVIAGVRTNKANPEAKPPRVNLEEGGKSGVHIEDRVAEYINRRRTSGNETNSGETKSAPGKVKPTDHASGKDKFSDYIDRTKNKLKKTLSIGGGGRSNSFK